MKNNWGVPLLAWTVLWLLLWALLPVFAQDGHAKYHDHFYSKLKQSNGISCCNDQDCRPATYRQIGGRVEFFIGDRWIVAPQEKVQTMVTPDGGGHWCGIGYATFCAILPVPTL